MHAARQLITEIQNLICTLDGGSSGTMGVRIEGPESVTAGPNETVSLTATGAPAGATYAWSGKGNPVTGTGSTFATRFPTPGHFLVKVVATGVSGETAAAEVTVHVLELSGRAWVTRFPGSRSTSTLAPAFAKNVDAFLAALAAAEANVEVSATFRPLERTYLMHYAWRLDKDGLDPLTVPSMEGVDVMWVHRSSDGEPDLAASRAAAAAMVEAYRLKVLATLGSRHIKGRAIDMTITWTGTLDIQDAAGATVSIKSEPRTGLNPDLHVVGASYGLVKLVEDPPHWSDDGH